MVCALVKTFNPGLSSPWTINDPRIAPLFDSLSTPELCPVLMGNSK